MRSVIFALILLFAAGQASAQTIVEFGAPWCEPCQRMQPTIAELEQLGVKFDKHNIDKEPKLAARYGVGPIPCFIAYDQAGREVGRIVGSTSAAELQRLWHKAAAKKVHTVKKAAPSQFVITGSFSPEFLHQATQRANDCRRQLALDWLGYELPPWPQPAVVTLIPANHSGGGSTQFVAFNGRVEQFTGTWEGPPDRLLSDVIPHEVMHTVLVSHFRQYMPRWADEGIATYNEGSTTMRDNFGAKLVEGLRTGRGIPTNQLFNLVENYGPDWEMLYAHGISMTRFLIEANGQQGMISFLEDALRKGWDPALAAHFDIANRAEFQNDWLDWVKAGSPAAPHSAGFAGRCCFRWRPLKRAWEARPGVLIPKREKAPSAPPAIAGATGPLAPVPPKPTAPSLSGDDGWRPSAPPDPLAPVVIPGQLAQELADCQEHGRQLEADLSVAQAHAKRTSALLDRKEREYADAADATNAERERLRNEVGRLGSEREALAERLGRVIASPPVDAWLTAKGTALLVGAGLPGWLAAGAIWIFRRRVKRRLAVVNEEPAGDAPLEQGSVRRQRINRYVQVDTSREDKAWLDAIRILIEKFPGEQHILRRAERLKNQLLAGEVTEL